MQDPGSCEILWLVRHRTMERTGTSARPYGYHSLTLTSAS